MYFIVELLNNYVFVWTIIITTFLYFILTKNHGYWASRNVKFIRPLPLFGTSFLTTFCIVPGYKVQQKEYNYLKGQRYGGLWNFWKPKLLILDPELIEHIMIKDFSYFTDREKTVDVDRDPLGKHLFNQNGNNWKTLRSKLTPIFSSGKLKTMIQQVVECADACVEHVGQKAALEQPVEIREEMAGFTMDVIGSCAFGLNINAINDPNSQLKKLGQMVFAPSRTLRIRGLLRSFVGYLLKLIHWKNKPNSFGQMIMNIMKYRDTNNFRRNDFIQLMMEVRKEEEKQLKDGTISEIIMDDNTISSNAIVFLLAGYETTATTLSYVLYELSQNPEIQEKVKNEVENVLKKYEGDITWEGLAEMKYIDLVISETLRKHSPAFALVRQSVKPYKVPNSDLVLPKGSVVVVPIYSLHHDPKYHPDPEKFDPERFSEENKHKLVKSTYLPFGDGPRICIGLRFARMEMKIAITKLIMKYKFSLNSKTPSTLQYSAKTFLMVPEGGIWLEFTPRTNRDLKMYFIVELLTNYVIVWSIIVTTGLYFILTKNHSYWASRNVKFIRPLPLFGTSFLTVFSIAPGWKVQQEQYNYLKGQRYGGLWGFWKPKLLLLDPELIEHIMVKDFSYFTDREGTIDVDTDPLARHLVNQNGNSWKTLRTKLTPVFSSGKLKTMIQQIVECSNACVEHIGQKAAPGQPLEVREEMAGFTMDVIGSCAFGLNINAINDPNSKLKQMSQMIFAPSRTMKLRRSLGAHFGFLLKLVRWKNMPGTFAVFFKNTIMSIVKYREENNYHRNDFIQLMMELRKEEEKQLMDGAISQIVMDDNTITSNAFVFLLAGYETTATTLGYTLYELSQNPAIQEKVYNEVENVLKKYKGDITWEGLTEMKYVDMVISETLRKHPPAFAVSRQSVKTYKVPNSDLELPKGSVVIVPIYSIHHDPNYYPSPEKFEPERFSEENKHKLVKSTYLPFGDGPRICIGLRFAKMEMKIAIAKLILKYKFSLNSKTKVPLQYSAQTFLLVPIGGIWIEFTPRTNKK
ncbi:uncharacterized protein [Halyomorpha halys]|uniref:uncharacterized protein n=1 Tax=Halyomorpha halys TaxID=286706 RepID=UPI000D0C7469|nr:uncharacterized protein LOC106678897 [Halyomorpha halys]